MYTNQYKTPQYSRYNQQYQPYPSNYNQMYNNYNQQPAYNAPPPTQKAATFLSLNVPTVQQPQLSTPGQNVTSLWMGNLEPYMTKSFITGAFLKMGENPTSVKVMRNKNTFTTAGYAFVGFYDPVHTMHKLNGKIIPGTTPPVRFKLNHAENHGKTSTSKNIFSVWVGELSSDVDDYQLYKTFACRYQSILKAKVVFDNAGYSKGYGFICFHSEEEQKHCLNSINGFTGLGSKPLIVSSIVPASKHHIVVSSNDPQGYKASQDYGQYFETNSNQNCALKPEPAIKTNGNLNLVDYKNHVLNKNLVIQDYNLWKGIPNFFSLQRPI